MSFKSCERSHGVMVSTLDFESSDPSSNLGGTFTCSIFSLNDVALHDNNFFRLTKSDCKYYGRSQSIFFFRSLRALS